MLKHIDALTRLGTRQGAVADQALEYLCSVLRQEHILYVIGDFETALPEAGKASLLIEGTEYPCINCGLSGGSIPGSNFASSLISSKCLIDTPVIYCNPSCAVASPTNFSFAPAIAVAPDIFERVIRSSDVKASTVVAKKAQVGHYLLVGNAKDPSTIVFSHYDSLGPGAVDNASGTAIMLEAVISQKKLLETTLFVFDGNEEVSYDYPTYWGHGYRAFESAHMDLMERAARLVVVDSVGSGDTIVISDPKIANLAFPIQNQALAPKISVIAGDIRPLMRVYHSELDRVDVMDKAALSDGLRILSGSLA